MNGRTHTRTHARTHDVGIYMSMRAHLTSYRYRYRSQVQAWCGDSRTKAKTRRRRTQGSRTKGTAAGRGPPDEQPPAHPLLHFTYRLMPEL